MCVWLGFLLLPGGKKYTRHKSTKSLKCTYPDSWSFDISGYSNMSSNEIKWLQLYWCEYMSFIPCNCNCFSCRGIYGLYSDLFLYVGYLGLKKDGAEGERSKIHVFTCKCILFYFIFSVIVNCRFGYINTDSKRWIYLFFFFKAVLSFHFCTHAMQRLKSSKNALKRDLCSGCILWFVWRITVITTENEDTICAPSSH